MAPSKILRFGTASMLFSWSHIFVNHAKFTYFNSNQLGPLSLSTPHFPLHVLWCQWHWNGHPQVGMASRHASTNLCVKSPSIFTHSYRAGSHMGTGMPPQVIQHQKTREDLSASSIHRVIKISHHTRKFDSPWNITAYIRRKLKISPNWMQTPKFTRHYQDEIKLKQVILNHQ